jgi:hypothetical protein
VAELVRVGTHLKNPNAADREEQVRRALSAMGKFSSG